MCQPLKKKKHCQGRRLGPVCAVFQELVCTLLAKNLIYRPLFLQFDPLRALREVGLISNS